MCSPSCSPEMPRDATYARPRMCRKIVNRWPASDVRGLPAPGRIVPAASPPLSPWMVSRLHYLPDQMFARIELGPGAPAELVRLLPLLGLEAVPGEPIPNASRTAPARPMPAVF